MTNHNTKVKGKVRLMHKTVERKAFCTFSSSTFYAAFWGGAYRFPCNCSLCRRMAQSWAPTGL